MNRAACSGGLIDPAPLDAAEARLRRALSQRDEWRWTHRDDGSAILRNQRTGKQYRVTDTSCTCGDWADKRRRGIDACKHQLGLRLERLERGE